MSYVIMIEITQWKKSKKTIKLIFLKKKSNVKRWNQKKRKKKMSSPVNFLNSWPESLNQETLYIEKSQIPIPKKSNVEGWNH
jgi:hypothetical protein